MSNEPVSHVIWYYDEKTGRTENVVVSDSAVADILWDRLKKAGKVMMNQRLKPRREYGGLKDGTPRR